MATQFNVGDTVRDIGLARTGYSFSKLKPIGKVTEVTEYDDGPMYQVEYDASQLGEQYTDASGPYQFAYLEAELEAAAEPKFNVGDTVRVTGGIYSFSPLHPIGKVVELRKHHTGSIRYRVEFKYNDLYPDTPAKVDFLTTFSHWGDDLALHNLPAVVEQPAVPAVTTKVTTVRLSSRPYMAVLNHLKAVKSISVREAMDDYSLSGGHLTKIISTLRADGHKVWRAFRKHPVTGKRYARYFYGEDAQAA